MENELLQGIEPGATASETGYAAFEKWAGGLGNQGLSPSDMDPGVNPFNSGGNIKNDQNSLLGVLDKVKDTENTADFSYREADISKRYPKNYLGIDNEELYAQNQSTMQKAYNGVVKMAGTAGTTFINGTAGTVYGIMKASETGKLQSFYDNDLSNYLNDINTSMEDTYAHYKTEREINGDWWEPSNLFTANFLFDNVIKNLGFSLGAAAAGFAWGGALEAIGLTGRLVASGKAMATAADTAVSEASVLSQVERMATINQKLGSLWNSTKATVGTGLMKADQGIVATFGTFGESGLEALNNSQEFRKNMIGAYTKEHGYAPEGEALKQINQDAESVGNWSFGLNTVLLTATNYIQLPKIYSSSFKAEKEILNNIAYKAGEYVSTLPEKGFGKYMYGTRKALGLTFNTAEAFEEGAQYAIQTGTQNYYRRKEQGYTPSVLDDGILHGVKEALTTNEGLLNIFTGGFSGALQSSGIFGVKKTESGWKPTIGGTGKIAERGVFGFGGEEAQTRNEALEALNSTTIVKKFKEVYENVKAAESIQQDRERAIRLGDILESKDLEFDYAHNFVTSRLKYNAKKSIDFEISELKQQAVSTGGFDLLQKQGIAPSTDTKESFIARLDNLQKHADSAATMYDSAKIKYQGLIKDGKRVYSDEVIDQLVYAGSKVLNYDERLTNVNNKLSLAGITSTTDVLSEIATTGKVSDETFAKGIAEIKDKKSINEDDLIQDFTDLAELAIRKEKFTDEYKEIKSVPQNFAKAEEDKPDAPKQKITIKTKNGDREIEVGTEYVLGKVTEYSKGGHEVYRQPRLTVLGKNADGTIKIKSSNGIVKDISVEEFLDYSLTLASKMKDNKKFAYFESVQNAVFEHWGKKKKDGTPYIGRLEYSEEKDRLTFVYVDEKGVVRKSEVWNTMFKAQKDFKLPMLRQIGTLTAQQEAAKKEFTEAKTTVSQKLQTRNNIISGLYTNGVKRVEEINRKLEQNKETLTKETAALEAQIAQNEAQGNLTKKGTVRKRPNIVLKRLVKSLSDLHTNITNENNELEEEKQDLEATIPFFKDFLDSLETLPENSKEMMRQLKKDIDVLEDLIDITRQAIKDNDSLLSKIEEALGKALSIFNDFIKRLKEENPSIPLSIEDLQSNIERFYGEEGAKQFIEDRLGFTNQVLELESEINDFSDELKIPDMNKQADKLVEDIKELQAGLDNLINEQIAKAKILDAFKEFAEQAAQIKAEEEQMQSNEELKEAFIGTMMNSVQNFFGGSYEPASKKTSVQVVTSTRPIDDGKPHQQRANTFGFNLPKMKNKDKIRSVIVTAKTEDQILPGLTDYFLSDISDADKLDKAKNEIIYLVMVDETGTPVDVDGNQITKAKDRLANAIYQVFPSNDLKGNYLDENGNFVYGSMFRNDVTPSEEAFLRKKYAAWRAEQLEQTTLSNLQKFQASFGIPKLVTYRDEHGKVHVDSSARTSAESAGLITPNMLRQKKVVEVATTGEAVADDSNTVFFEQPKGRVLLRIPGAGLAKLFNRKFNEQEAHTIFDVIHQIAKNTTLEGKFSPETNLMFDWLKSVMYWGFAHTKEGKIKPHGYNNVWFETVDGENGKPVTKLYISGKSKETDQGFIFTPSKLEENKQSIVYLLTQLYNNTNATKVNDENAWSEPYYQITGVNTDGTTTTIKWPNYQTYLLSEKAPDETGKLTIPRKDKELPLATQFQPITEDNPVNRQGIYFTLYNNAELFNLPEQEEEPVKTPKAEPKAKQPTVTQDKPIVKDGSTLNIITHEKLGDIVFTVDENDVVDLDLVGSTGAILALAKDDTPAAQNKAANILIQSIEKKIAEQPEEVKVEEAPKVDTPVVLDGETVNTITNPALGPIVFTATKEGVVTLNVEASGDAIVALATSKNIPQNKAGNILIASVEKKIAPLVVKEQLPVEPPIEDSVEKVTIGKKNRPVPTPVDRSKLYRLKRVQEAKQFSTENWKKVEEFIAANFPNVPVYRVKNIIQATNGRQAWGMFHEGAIYVYENAEIGTAYHEVFEGVWKMFSGPKEKSKIIKEFKNTPGSFEEQDTGKTINYSEATDAELKEELAEEFRRFVLTGETVERKAVGTNFIHKLFLDIVNFIKEFFTGASAISNTQKLFDKIGNGYYKQYNPYTSKLAYANTGIIDIEDTKASDDSELRVKGIPQTQLHDIVQQMTYSTLSELVKDNKSLFSVTKQTNQKKTALYARLKDEILNLINWEMTVLTEAVVNKEATQDEIQAKYNNLDALYDNVEEQWEDIVETHMIQLKAYSIEFDENDDAILTDEDASGKSDWQPAEKIDSFRKANSAVKLMLGTLPETTIIDGESQWKPSTIGGVNLMAADQVYIDLVSKLYNSLDIDDMFRTLGELAKTNKNYDLLYQRMTKSVPGISINYDNVKDHDFHLMTSFYKAMKKQNADVITVFILPSGEVVISDSTLSSAAKQSKREMITAISSTLKGDESNYFKYNKSNGKYYATNVVKNLKLNVKALEGYVNFLKNIGIDFNINDLRKLSRDKPYQFKVFTKAVEGMRESFATIGDKITITDNEGNNSDADTAITVITTKTLGIDKRLSQLGLIKAILENPEFESTYFNINGEKSQSFIGTNSISNLHDVLSKLTNISQLENTPFRYLLTDKFTKGSVLLAKMFDISDDSDGGRIDGTEDLLKPTFIDGTNNEDSGKKKQSSKQSYKERLVQEINLNSSGRYLNLVPGDASLEHAIKMHEEKNAFVSASSFANKEYLNIFRGYFTSEVELARDNRYIADVKGRTNKDLRFFKDILGKELHDEIIFTKENAKKSPDALYEKYKAKIESAVKHFIENEAQDTENLLRNFGVINNTANGLEINDLLLGEDVTSQEVLDDKLRLLTVNYMIANVEMHKLIYSDPYQYKDELKRIKNFNSPGQPLVAGSPNVNSVLDELYNVAKGFVQGDVAWSDMLRDHFRSVTLADVLSVSPLKGYDPFEETDGGGYISLSATRKFKLRDGSWTEDNERQYAHDMEYERMAKAGANAKELSRFDRNNPGIKDTYTPLKPIVRGSKINGRGYNDIVLHKFALVPLSFRVLHLLNPESNAIKLYNKMQREDIDYAVYASGSKVGTEKVSPLYNSKGEFDETPYESEEEKNGLLANNELRGVNKIPFDIIAVQSEVPSKDAPIVTQGSQVTKLVTMDFMEAGVPIDFQPDLEFNERFAQWIAITDESQREQISPLYKEIKNNQRLLEAKTQEGYNTLLKKLGLKETKEGFVIDNIKKLTNTLRDEIFKREVNYNLVDAFDGFENGDVVLEATPVYQQIRNILYSIADKNIVRPKISGGMKVQIPSTLLESSRVEAVEVNGKLVHQSNILKFYEDEDGKRVCEIMVGRWFKSNKTDAELLDYFNNSKEGQAQLSALSGVAFRTPTQKQNSIDAFRIKQFLPKEFGDSVVIPSALVKKVGSDFDIDKLSIYLKNLIPSNNKDMRVVPYFGIGEEAKKKFEELYDKGEFNSYLAQRKEAFQMSTPEDRLLASIFQEDFSMQRSEVVSDLYIMSLENAYIQSMEDLITHPSNFENLVKPNDATPLKDLSAEIQKQMGNEAIDYASVGNMLNRRFMSQLRQAFVTGKQAIGIAAVAQTGHAQKQRTATYIDLDRLKGELIDETDKTILGGDPKSVTFASNPNINFQKYNKAVINGKQRPILSMIKNQVGDFISDINGMFIDGYVDISKGPWIMELGATPNVASTWLFLIDLGVPINTVAYFMNQPIIRDYLRTIESNGYSWLFIENMVEDMLDIYSPSDEKMIAKGIPSEKALFDMIAFNKPGTKSTMSDEQKAQQQYMLKEFLKYAKMASHMFEVTRGSNLDTANINDPYLIFKKYMQYKKGQKTVISSIDDILDASFVGSLKHLIDNFRDAFATILLSDRKGIRTVMEQVLAPYVNLSDRDFVKVSQRAVNDLFDWVVQTSPTFGQNIATILLGTDTQKSAAQQILDFRDSVIGNKAKGIKADESHPLYDNIILNSLRLEEHKGKQEGKPFNLYIAGLGNKVYDQNLIIYGFSELRDYMKSNNKSLYTKLVRLAVLQSGLSNSKIAFTNLLPYEDFKDVYNNTLSDLENLPNLADFFTLGVFERNNWNNTDVVPFKKAKLLKKKDSNGRFNPDEILDTKLFQGWKQGRLPLMRAIPLVSSEGRSDYITYSWEDYITSKERARRRKVGDYSHVHKALMQKVYTVVDGKVVPLIQVNESNGKVYRKYIYKAINAWGDSFRANEFYNEAKPSVIDNDYEKVVQTTNAKGVIIKPNEVSDDEIAQAYTGKKSSTTKLKDGKGYTDEQINSTMLEAMDYSKLEIGRILKSIC